MIPDEIKEKIEHLFILPWQILFMIIILIIIAYTSLIWFEEDNFIEQSVEYVIEKEAGFSVDFTPKKTPM